MQTIDLAYTILIGGAGIIFLIRCLYFCYRGYRKTHKQKPVIEKGVHVRDTMGILLYDAPERTWGKLETKAQTAGLAAAFCLLAVLIIWMFANHESVDTLQAPTMKSQWAGD